MAGIAGGSVFLDTHPNAIAGTESPQLQIGPDVEFLRSSVLQMDPAGEAGASFFAPPAAGGAIACKLDQADAADGVSLQISDSLFRGNQALDGARGGALVTSNKCLTTIERTRFDRNEAPDGVGGAVYATDQSEIQLLSGQVGAAPTLFANNGAMDGGAVALDLKAVLTSDLGDGLGQDEMVMFSSNQATNERGGAIACAEASVFLEGAKFLSNLAPDAGGAIATDNCWLWHQGGQYRDNSLDDSAVVGGGAVYASYDGSLGSDQDFDLSLSQLEFFENTSVVAPAGAILVQDQGLVPSGVALDMSQVIVSRNTGDKGAVLIRGRSDSEQDVFTLRHSVIAGNFKSQSGAPTSGLSIYDHVNYEVIDSVLAYNEVDEQIQLEGASPSAPTGSITYSILWADSQPASYVSGGAAGVCSCDSQAEGPLFGVEPGWVGYDASGPHTEDPGALLVYILDFDFHPASSSPMLGASSVGSDVGAFGPGQFSCSEGCP